MRTSNKSSYKGSVTSRHALVTISFKHGIPPGLYDKRIIQSISSINTYKGLYLVFEKTKQGVPHMHLFVTFKNNVRDSTRNDVLDKIKKIVSPHDIENAPDIAYNIKAIKTTEPDNAMAYLFKYPIDGYPITDGEIPGDVIEKLKKKCKTDEAIEVSDETIEPTIKNAARLKNCSSQACIIFIREFMKSHDIAVNEKTREFNKTEIRSIGEFKNYINDHFDLYGTYSTGAINETMKLLEERGLLHVFPTFKVDEKYIKFKDCYWNLYSGKLEALEDNEGIFPVHSCDSLLPTEEFFDELEKSLRESTNFSSEELEDFRKSYGEKTRPWKEGNKGDNWFGASGSGKTTLTKPLRRVFGIKSVDFADKFSYSQIDNSKNVTIMNEFSPYEHLKDTNLLKILEGETTDVPVKHKTDKRITPINVIAISNVIPPVPIHPKDDATIQSQIELIHSLLKDQKPEGDHPKTLVEEIKIDKRFEYCKKLIRPGIKEDYVKEEILRVWFENELTRYTELFRMKRRLREFQFVKSIEDPKSSANKFFEEFGPEFLVWTTRNNEYIDYDAMPREELMRLFFGKK